MKKFILTIVFLFTVLYGFQANALELKAGEEIYINQEVNDDLYVAGGSVDTSQVVNGDLMIAGGEVNVDSSVMGDLFIAGGNIDVSGNVSDDVRVFGGNVRINSNIGGDLIVGAGTVRISKGVVINGDLVAGGGRIILDGDVKGNLNLNAGQLVLNGIVYGDANLFISEFGNNTNSGEIIGNLKYKSDKKIEELEKSTKGEVVFEKYVLDKKTKKNIIGFLSIALIVKLLGLFVFSIIFYFYFQKFFSKASDNLKNSTGKSFLNGFVVIFGVPLLAIILFITGIGLPFGLFFLFLYIFLFVFLDLISVIVFSSYFIDKYKISNIYKKLGIILGLSILFGLINGIDIIAGFFTLGAVVIRKLEILESIRKNG